MNYLEAYTCLGTVACKPIDAYRGLHSVKYYIQFLKAMDTLNSEVGDPTEVPNKQRSHL